MKGFQLSVFYFFFVYIIQAQSVGIEIIAIPLQKDPLDRIIINTRSIFSDLKDSLHFAGIPEHLKSYKLKFFSFNPAQHHYDRYRKGLLSKEGLQKWFNQLQFDSTQVKSQYFKHTTYALAGLTSAGNKIVIVDNNQNLDFSDDERIEVDTTFSSLAEKEQSQKLGNLPKIKMQYEYMDENGSRKTNHIWFFIDPYSNALTKYPSEIDKALEVGYVYKQWETGELNDRGKSYNFFVKKSITYPAPYKGGYIQLYFRKNMEKLDRNDFYGIGDTLTTQEQQSYVFNRLSSFGDTLFLQKLPEQTHQFGYRPGFYSKDAKITFVGGDSTRIFSILSSNKYLILDFWGTWCKPCIDKIPDIKKLNSKIASSSKIEMISIAYDKDIEKVKNFIYSQNLNWPNGFELMSDKSLKSDSPIHTLNVQAYPSFFLIQPDGKIITTDFDEINKWVDANK
jgi:thiol-disulfide isomerase/thioredoxin